jgi:hypothetical protein
MNVAATQLKEAGDYPASDLSRTLPLVCNVEDKVLYANVQRAVEAGYPILEMRHAHNDVALLVGGGPSLADDVEDIRQRKAQGAHIFALNGAGLWLQERGIIPDCVVILDARPHNARFVAGLDQSVICLLATQCDAAIFEAAGTRHIVAWHPNLGGKSGVVEKRATVLIGGSTTVGMRTMRIAHVLGYRELHLFGYDSSYRDMQHHAYRQDENSTELLRECVVGGQTFVSSAWMIRQAGDFPLICGGLMCEGTSVHVHGNGLLPAIATEMGRERRLLTVYYDLSVCPVGYDVIKTLAVAEAERKTLGLDGLRVVFVPGPNGGFRNNEMPFDIDQRRQMFWGICMGICRCLPSIRAISHLNSDAEIGDVGEHVYPYGYSADNRVGVYGIAYLIDAMHKGDIACFEAPEWARRQVVKWIRQNTVTITLREAGYVDGRNSLIGEWVAAADELKSRGYHVVFVRDTDQAFGADFHGHDVCHAASYDISMRLALYEAAAVNCFVANGPFTLGLLAPRAKCIVFGMQREGDFNMGAEHWKRRNLPVGSEYPNTHGRFKTVWQRESAANIVDAVTSFLNANPQRFQVTYDLSACPVSFDFIPWLIAAEMNRRRSGEVAPLHVFFASGPRDGFRDDALGVKDRNGFFEHAMLPSLELIGAKESRIAEGSRFAEPVYTIRPIVEAVRQGETIPLLSAPASYHDRVRAWLAEKNLFNPVVIVLREASHWPDRNSRLGNWERLAGALRGDGIDVVFVRDTEKADAKLMSAFPTCPEASRDILFQIALYEQARCVMATSAPGFIALFTQAPCLIFPVTNMPDYPPSSDAWWRTHHGIGHGEQFPWLRPDQRIIWTGDNYRSIRHAWDDFERLTKEKIDGLQTC